MANIIATENPIITTVAHPIVLDIRVLILFFRILLSFAILITTIRIGTATTPLMTAVYNNALIGSIHEKFIQSPITVDAAITSCLCLDDFHTKSKGIIQEEKRAGLL